MLIELKGRISEDGKIVFELPAHLPPGEVDIVISYPDPQEAEDEALWDAQFAATPASVFDALIEEGLNDYHTLQADEFDPHVEDD